MWRSSGAETVSCLVVVLLLLLTCVVAGAGQASTEAVLHEQPANGTSAKALIIAIGRSGSTLATELLAAATKGFVYDEPWHRTAGYARHYHIQENDMQRHVQYWYERLFDCTVFYNATNLLKLVAYKHSCHSGFVSLDDDFPNRCTEHRLTKADLQQLHNHCKRAPAHIVKTIRFRQATMMLPTIPGLRVIHLVRRPYDIAKGQFLLGWPFRGAYSRTASDILATERQHLSTRNKNLGGVFLRTIAFVCQQMKATQALLDKATETPHILIRYEDVIDSGPEALAAMHSHVTGVPGFASDFEDIYKAVAEKPFVNFPKIDSLVHVAGALSDEEWETMALEHCGACRQVYRRFGYMTTHVEWRMHRETTALDTEESDHR